MSAIISRFQEGSEEFVFKQLRTGESVASFLSCLVALADKESKFKTVAARALEDSKILRLRFEHLKELVKESPRSIVRLVQLIIVRLQRVNFNALHYYLGLTQMMKSRDRFRKHSAETPASKKVRTTRSIEPSSEGISVQSDSDLRTLFLARN